MVWSGVRVGLLVLLVGATLALAIPGAVASSPIQVFLLAGQSNMVGEGQPVSAGTGPKPNLVMWQGGAWRPASDPVTPLNLEPSGVGPAMTFGLDVLSHEPSGTVVGLIMCAEGGSSIRQWQPGKALYRYCVQAAQAAGGTVAGFVFLQGETEARSSSGGATWASGFANLEKQVQTDFGPIPVVLGQIGVIDSSNYPYQQAVRDAQAAAVVGHPEIALVKSSDLPISKDGVHFTLASEQTLGRRFGEAWASLKHKSPTPSPKPTSLTVSRVSPAAAAVGASVTITGRGLSGTQAVTFGGAKAAFSVSSDRRITATVPANATPGELVVSTGAASASATFSLLPSITSFVPASGPVGAKVLIAGTGFFNVASVAIRGVPLARVKVKGPTVLQGWIPVGAKSGPITVTTATGTATSPTFTVTP